ncbi:MAG: polysaccharide deacetylase family protein, partial [Verrucomicrobiota bacterium]
QIRSLKDDGFEIGSHTHRHRPLTDLSDEDAKEELARSFQTLERELNEPPSVFAYPRGFYEPKHQLMAREAGYVGACGVILRWRDLLGTNAWNLKRMTIKGTEDMQRFKWRLRAAHWVR